MPDKATSPWSRLARIYDWQLPLERRSLRRLIELLELRGGERLLDLGTGTGAVLEELDRAAARPREVIAVDPSPRMLARARASHPNVVLLRGDATRLTLPSASFEVVTAAYLLHLLDQSAREQALSECRRLLTSGGQLGVVTVIEPGGWLSMLARPLDRLASASSGPLSGLRPLDPRPELERAGFQLQACARVTRGYPALVTVARRRS
jgi:ubiquinone/menaquinone biosynthesis C-methylase UbiE